MRRILSMVLAGLLMSTLLSTAVMAEDVCVTKHGKKYHKVGSKFLKGKEFETISREEAETRGYKPSSEFFRDDAAAAQQGVDLQGVPVKSTEQNKQKTK